ncbi:MULTISPECIES: DUF397 domain-containing protein [unclassified Actinopolyspora]|uniref:DUF397 domain-containing protein n=1 Tax=unclassified Actinopolyspora TaxID=2639451 RepID=UPI0013F5C721|nr:MULTISPECIES: DUF397 domain-containing protein [unclassified Actinopolyspora]NHD18188.1 DUF397 domain-containing protein [Actinopolyspora sp. BKK2]NHE77133.1 DUF397 domain-containing protein [Actinopolyspora sp. BKK1]
MTTETRTALTAPSWRRSSYSTGTGNCVEVAGFPGGARRVRDTKDRDGGALALSGEAWAAFLDEVKAGRLGSA